MDDDTEYSLVMPFLDQSESFCHGYEMGLLNARMQAGEELEKDLPIHTENVEQAKLLANRFGYAVEFEDSGVDGWTYIMGKPEAPKPPRPLLRVIKGGLAS